MTSLKKLFEAIVLIFLREIALPIRLITRGGRVYILYILAMVALTLCAHYGADILIARYLKILKKEADLSEDVYERVAIALRFILTILCCFPLCVAMLLPIRILGITGSISPSVLFKQTPVALRIFGQTAFRAVVSSGYHFIPLFGIGVTYFAFVVKAGSEAFYYAWLVATLVLAIVTFDKLMALFLAPVIAVVGAYEGWYAMQIRAEVVKGKRIALSVYVVLLLSSIVAALSLGNYGGPIFLSFAFWFLFTLLGGRVLQSVAIVDPEAIS